MKRVQLGTGFIDFTFSASVTALSYRLVVNSFLNKFVKLKEK